MDHIDRKIIDLLQNNARAPLKEIADHVFLSSPAVSARMARLESSGTITGYQAQVDAPKLGYMVKAFINLDMDPQRKPEFYPYIRSCPHVVECNCVTGDYSMLIEVLYDAGAGSVHQPSAAVWPHPDANRLFDARGAPRRARSRAGGEAIKNKKPSPSGEGGRAKRGRMRAKFALFPVNGILPATQPSSVRFPRWGSLFPL